MSQEIGKNVTATPIGTQTVIFADTTNSTVAYQAARYERNSLSAGASFSGPAIVTQYDTTTVLPPDWRASVDAVGNLILERREGQVSHA